MGTLLCEYINTYPGISVNSVSSQWSFFQRGLTFRGKIAFARPVSSIARTTLSSLPVTQNRQRIYSNFSSDVAFSHHNFAHFHQFNPSDFGHCFAPSPKNLGRCSVPRLCAKDPLCHAIAMSIRFVCFSIPKASVPGFFSNRIAALCFLHMQKSAFMKTDFLRISIEKKLYLYSDCSASDSPKISPQFPHETLSSARYYTLTPVASQHIFFAWCNKTVNSCFILSGVSGINFHIFPSINFRNFRCF